LNCVEALAACFRICGHEDWAREVLKHFNYGEAFLEINSALFKRYAACATEEDIKKAEEEWLAKIEREYEENRAEGGADDMWTVGNTNRRAAPTESDEEEEGDVNSDEGEGDEDEDVAEEEEQERDPYAISDDSEDEAQMAEIRAKILNSKSFQNPSVPDKPQPEKIARPDQTPVEDSDAESGSAGSDDEEFDKIIDATPVTDRTGIIAASQRKGKGKETFSASFSRTVIDAPKRW
jgi:pre-rRNA-processing protein TSR3